MIQAAKNVERARSKLRVVSSEDLRSFGDMRIRYMAQSKLTTTEGGVAPLPSLEEAQALLASSEAVRCRPQAALIERAAATIRGLFDRSSM